MSAHMAVASSSAAMAGLPTARLMLRTVCTSSKVFWKPIDTRASRAARPPEFRKKNQVWQSFGNVYSYTIPQNEKRSMYRAADEISVGFPTVPCRRYTGESYVHATKSGGEAAMRGCKPDHQTRNGSARLEFLYMFLSHLRRTSYEWRRDREPTQTDIVKVGARKEVRWSWRATRLLCMCAENACVSRTRL